MKHIRKILLWLFRIIGIFIGMLVLYFVLVIILTIIPLNRNAKQPKTGIQIFVRTNGIHTDFVLPVKTTILNWEDSINCMDFKQVYNPTYISFGWGDKGFYIETPEWSDLKASTAFKALFFMSSTAMHVSYLQGKPSVNKDCISIIISENQYHVLVNYILDSFRRNKDGNFLLIKNKGYDVNDNFYEANGTYSFIKTCNTWLNYGLRRIGIKTAIWAPFDKCIFYHLNKK
jgi:uncharacterized protein (TIGR02117 family)